MSSTTPRRGILWAGTVLAAAGLIAWLGSVARDGAPTWPVADGALIELYTIHATRGEQLLGAYSQYGWHHPGPLLFYLLAPFYLLGGRTVYGLDLGALVINLASLSMIAAIIGRRKDMTPASAVLLLVGLFAYLARLPSLLTSAWNPHVSVLPFAALLVCSAAALAGDTRMLLLVVFLASFVTQTHVGFAPVAGALGALAVAGIAYRAMSDGGDRRTLSWWVLAAVALLQLVWLPTLADELTGHPGNLTRIWRFFFETAETQTMVAALRSWSTMLIGLLQPDLTVAVGVGFAGSSSPWPMVLGALAVATLPIVAVARWRDGHRFESSLAIACFTASAVGFWSVLHIRGLIGDYQLFWLSVLGIFDLTLMLGLMVNAARRWMPVGPSTLPVARAAAVLLGIGTGLIGVSHLMLATRSTQLPDENEIVRRLTVQMRQGLSSMGAHRPLFRMDGSPWGIGSGLMLQLARASLAFSIDPDVAARFDPHLSSIGEEDVLVTLSGSDRHRELAARPGNATLATSDWARVHLYLDAVSLVDQPQYKP